MAGQSTITVDLARGEIVLGGCRIRLSPERDGHEAVGLVPTRFRLDDGAVVRAIAFGERSRLVREALAADDPSAVLLALLRAAAHEGPGGAVADAALLALAGGGEQAPAFDRCAVEASRLLASSWLSVFDAPAILVDRARQPAEQDHSGEWHCVVFPGASSVDLASLVREMLASLLARGVPGEGSREVAASRVAPSDPGPAARPLRNPRTGREASEWRRESSASDDPPPATAVVNPAAASAASRREAPLTPGVSSPVSASRASREGGLVPLRVHRRSAPAAAETRAAAAAFSPALAAISPLGSAAQASQPDAPIAADRPADVAAVPARTRALDSGRSAPAVNDSSRHQALTTRAAASSVAWRAVPEAAGLQAVHSHAAPLPPRISPAPSRVPALSVDAIAEVARALDAECDLRGLDA